MNFSFTSNLPTEVIQAFIDSAVSALRELVQQEAVIDNASHPTVDSEHVVAVIRLLRNDPGMMALVLEATSARRLTECYLPAGSELSDAMVEDVAAEFANVIAGQAKTCLKGSPFHFTLSIPDVRREWRPLGASANLASKCIAMLNFGESRLWLFLELSACPGA